MTDSLKPILSDAEFQHMTATLKGLRGQILAQRSLRFRDNEDIPGAEWRDMLNDLNAARAEDEDGWIEQAEAGLAEMAQHLPLLAGYDAEERQELYQDAVEDCAFFLRMELKLAKEHPELANQDFDPVEAEAMLKRYDAVRDVAEAAKKADEGLMQLFLRLEFPEEKPV